MAKRRNVQISAVNANKHVQEFDGVRCRSDTYQPLGDGATPRVSLESSGLPRECASSCLCACLRAVRARACARVWVREHCARTGACVSRRETQRVTVLGAGVQPPDLSPLDSVQPPIDDASTDDAEL